MSIEVNITGTAIEEVNCDRANISISLAFDGTSLNMIKTEYNQLLKEICDKIEAEVSSETESDPEYNLNSDILRVRQSTEKVQKMFKEDTKEKVQAYSCIRANLDRDSRGVFNVLLDTLYGFTAFNRGTCCTGCGKSLLYTLNLSYTIMKIYLKI